MSISPATSKGLRPARRPSCKFYVLSSTDFLYSSRSLPESAAETAMTNADPQSTAVHLSSDLHDICISQKLSETTSVLSPNFVPTPQQKNQAQILHIRRTSLLQQILPWQPIFPASQRTNHGKQEICIVLCLVPFGFVERRLNHRLCFAQWSSLRAQLQTRPHCLSIHSEISVFSVMFHHSQDLYQHHACAM